MSNYSITPIGGVGEIGSNMTLVESRNEAILIDAGILFPYEDFFDINYLIPDLNSLVDKNIKSLIITHGHEDHIGAIAHLLKILPKINVYAGLFSKELIEYKLLQWGIKKKITLYEQDSILNIGDFEIHPIHVNHSIPHTFALFFNHTQSNSSFFYASDFKYDEHSPYEEPFNIEKLISLTNKSKHVALFIDSTNILSEHKTPSENDLINPLSDIFSHHCNNRLFITLFASNIHRIQTIFNLAHQFNRKVCLVGRSIKNYTEIAKKTGLLRYDESNTFELEDALESDHKVVYIVSGCQGDHFSALNRIASGHHHTLKIVNDDIFIFSSKAIPGNEKKIQRIYNKIINRNGQVINLNSSLVHASGHPGQKDLRMLLDNISHNNITYVPIHGESFFLKKHVHFANKFYPHFKTILISNYQSILFHDKHGFTYKENEPYDPILIHGNGFEIERDKIAERRKAACNGIIFIATNKKKGTTSSRLYGLPNFAKEHQQKLDQIILKNIKSSDENIRILARRFYSKILGYKPVTIVINQS